MKYRDYSSIYIGRLIQQRVDELGLTYAEFARRIHSSRTNLYRLFNCKSIDVERLLLISEVLDYDFIHEIYTKKAIQAYSVLEDPCLILPLKDGSFCLDKLSEELRDQLRQALLEK